MDDIWPRIGLIAVVLAVAASIALLQRRRALDPVKSLNAPGFDAGVYFFSSGNCATCDRARETLLQTLGRDGYAEISWETGPGHFANLQIDAVPAVMIVDDRGRGRLYPGQPDKVLAELDP